MPLSEPTRRKVTDISQYRASRATTQTYETSLTSIGNVGGTLIRPNSQANSFSLSISVPLVTGTVQSYYSPFNVITKQNSVTLSQDQNFRPVRLSILGNKELPTAQLVESRLHSLRQIYAISFLIDAGRKIDISNATTDDLEDLIDPADRLFIVSAGQGSFWLEVTAKTAAGIKSLKNIVPLLLDEGRQAVLERAKANTELAKLEVKKKHLEIDTQKANAVIDIYNRVDEMKDPIVKELFKAKLTESIIASGNLIPILPSSKLPKNELMED